jgi:thioredoxin reductase (NADPH)
VHLIIRRDALHASMSRYLVDRIERNPGIVVWPSTHVTALTGTDKLEAVRLGREGQPGNLRSSRNRVVRLYRGEFIGAKPGTRWLAGQLAEDKHGFLLTGSDIPAVQLEHENLTPFFLETSRPGVFAAGDVRSGSIKRVAAAIGEGSVAVRLAFERLEAAGAADPIGMAAR